ncbi:MAG TPA: response regulator [Candidatus Angelobacter sp.]|nr:response regulator [Candidatus Angelobacter sp.]
MKEQKIEKKQNSHGQPKEPAKKSVTVLHVDDDPNDTTLLQVACAKADVNFELLNIHDANAVIEYLSSADRPHCELPALVLLDMKMPRAAGMEVLKWIRNQSALKHLPVFVLSGSEMHEDIRQAYEGGANGYLVKPPNFDSLVKMVRDIRAHLPAPPPSHRAAHSCA